MGKLDWKKGFNPDQLLTILDNSKKIENGEVSYTGWEVPSILIAINQSIDFPEQYSEIDQYTVTKEALREVALEETLTRDKVMRCVQEIANKHLKSIPKNYFLLSELSINFLDIVSDEEKPNKNQINISIDGNEINYSLYNSPTGIASGTITFEQISYNQDPTQESFQELKRYLLKILRILKGRNQIKNVLIKKMSFKDIQVSFYRGGFPRKFNNRNEFIHSLRSETNDDACYVFTVIKVIAKNKKSGFKKALKFFHALRAFLCLINNPFPSFEYNFGPSKPINSVRSGEVSTLHDENGDAYPIVDKDPDFQPKEIIVNETKALDEILKVFKLTQKSPYKNKLTEALNCYVTALDSKDHNVGLMRIWNAIEVLTSKQEDSFDKVIKRFSLVYANEPYRLQILKYIRDFRNRFVHNNVEDTNARHYCFELQKAFFDMLIFQIRNRALFKGFDDVLAFLDLPKTKSALKVKARFINRAIKYAK